MQIFKVQGLEMKLTIQFTIASKINTFGKILTKESANLVTENYKILLTEIKNLNKC